MSEVEVRAGLGHLDARSYTAASPSLRHFPSISYRRLKVVSVLAIGDGVAAIAAVAIEIGLFRLFDVGNTTPFGMVAVLTPAAFLICLSLLLGLYETSRSNPVEIFRLRVLSAFVFAIVVDLTLERSLSLLAQVAGWATLVVLVVVLGSIASGLAQMILTRFDIWQTRVVLVGDAGQTRTLAAMLETAPALGMRVLARAAFDDPRLRNPAGFADQPAELAVLLSSGDGHLDAQRAESLNFASVIIARDAGDMQTLWLNSRMIGSAIGIEIRRSLLARNLVVKRAMDLLIGTIMLLSALPIVAATAAAVWCVDRHNPFYAQARIGLGGRIVRVWKVRSMFKDAESRLEQHLASDPVARAEWERSFKLSRDPRILPGLGQFIRRTSLDELPQLWNIVRGDMSLVGPRPFPAYHLAGFDEPFRALRSSVTPGLTGYWQITCRSDSTLEIQKNADTFYVRNWSIWFDLYILLHTMPAVVFGKGAR